MREPTTNPIAEINETRVLKVKWPDETCIFVNEEFSNGILTIKYRLKDAKPGQQAYENSYSLDAFDTKIGIVKKVKFKKVNTIKNVSSIS